MSLTDDPALPRRRRAGLALGAVAALLVVAFGALTIAGPALDAASASGETRAEEIVLLVEAATASVAATTVVRWRRRSSRLAPAQRPTAERQSTHARWAAPLGLWPRRRPHGGSPPLRGPPLPA